MAQPDICPHCGQPIVPAGLALPAIKARIYEAVRRRPGISAETLRGIVWDDPSGGPDCRHTIYVHIYQTNRILAPHGLKIRFQNGYRIRSA